jgi:hypothetical protein
MKKLILLAILFIGCENPLVREEPKTLVTITPVKYIPYEGVSSIVQVVYEIRNTGDCIADSVNVNFTVREWTSYKVTYDEYIGILKPGQVAIVTAQSIYIAKLTYCTYN